MINIRIINSVVFGIKMFPFARYRPGTFVNYIRIGFCSMIKLVSGQNVHLLHLAGIIGGGYGRQTD